MIFLMILVENVPEIVTLIFIYLPSMTLASNFKDGSDSYLSCTHGFCNINCGAFHSNIRFKMTSLIILAITVDLEFSFVVGRIT